MMNNEYLTFNVISTPKKIFFAEATCIYLMNLFMIITHSLDIENTSNLLYILLFINTYL